MMEAFMIVYAFTVTDITFMETFAMMIKVTVSEATTVEMAVVETIMHE